MRMICPHCGLGGTTDQERYLKKVKCPGCSRLFRVNEHVVVDPVPPVQDQIVEPLLEIGEMDDDQQDHISTDLQTGDSVAVPGDFGLLECDVCGFSFSSDFIRVIDGRHMCPVCAN